LTTALHIEGLRKTYPNGPEALRGVDLRVEAGDFFALLGPNGAGKSTAIGIVCSLVNKSGGRVSVFGHDLDRERAEVKRAIGLVPQEFNFNQFEPVEEILINQAGYYGVPRPQARERAERYLRQLDLWDKRRVMARQLSGGMKRRLMIARALVHRPRLLILDEPTAGVDIEIRRSMWHFMRALNREGVTIILTTHYLDEAETLCRNLGIINRGRVVEQAPVAEVLGRLHAEGFVLNLAEPLHAPPDLEDFEFHLADPYTLEVCVDRQHHLNALFVALDREGIQVRSMRNKQNRLEQLLLDLLSDGDAA